MQRTISPTTTLGEKSRSAGLTEQRSSQPHSESDWMEGKIKAVDKKRKVVKVADKIRGNDLFGGAWIPLGHSVHDILDRFGTNRLGMEVMVFYKGKLGTPVSALAFIVGEEDESGPNKDLVANDVAQAFHNILMENL